MNGNPISLSSLIADAALTELASRQVEAFEARSQADILAREVDFLRERLDAAHRRADALESENRSLRLVADARRAAIIEYTMQRSADPLPDIVRPGVACSIMIALRSDKAHDHSHACAELAAMLARQPRGARHE